MEKHDFFEYDDTAQMINCTVCRNANHKTSLTHDKYIRAFMFAHTLNNNIDSKSHGKYQAQNKDKYDSYSISLVQLLKQWTT